jgi:hypothetical protein
MIIKKTALVLAFAAALTMPAMARAQDGRAAIRPSASAPAELTALDYIQIQQLVAKYAAAIDSCSNNGYDYADLFTADGYYAPFVNGAVGRKFQGRDELARASGGGPNGCTGAGWIRQGVHHIYTNHIITPTADGATGTVDMLMIGIGGDPNKIVHDGFYDDTYARTANGWRFKSRVHHALTDAGRPRRAPGATATAPESPPGQPR